MDRFFRGFVAGIIGGVVMNVWDLFSHDIIHFTKLRYLDWTGVILYGHLPQNLWEIVYALILQLVWVGVLGVIFAFLIPQVTSRGYLIKAVIYALIVGFIIYAIPALLRTPFLTVVTFSTTVSNHIGGILWSLVMVQSLRWLDRNQLLRPKINK